MSEAADEPGDRLRGGHLAEHLALAGRVGDVPAALEPARHCGHSLTMGLALAVDARRSWRRDLLRASPGAGTTLPTRTPREHVRRRHDGGSGCVACSVTRCGRTDPAPPQPETWAALAYLVVVGSVVVFLLYLVVLRYWAASRASCGFPSVTVSAWLDNEPVNDHGLTALTPVGSNLGSWIR
jgi:hypothetical protein